MSTNPIQADSSYGKFKRIAITNVDSWLGCCIALHVAQELERKCNDVQIVAMARKTDKLDKLRKLKNVRIEQVDYERKDTLERAFKGVCATILIPEMDDRRVEQAKHVLYAMKKEGVRACMMISVAGANEAGNSPREGLRTIQQFHEIEKEVQRECDKCFLIMRKSILNQSFLLWAPIVQERKELPMPCEPSCQLAPLDACDLVRAVEHIVVELCKKERDDPHEGFGEHRNRTYTLTGPESITPEHLSRELSEVTGENIEFRHVSRQDLKKYLESLKHRYGWTDEVDVEGCEEILKPLGNRSFFEGAAGMVTEAAESAARLAKGGNRDRDDRPRFAPNEAMIELLLDELELVKEKKAGFVSHDLEKIIGRRGHPIKEFFRKEKDAFKPHRA